MSSSLFYPEFGGNAELRSLCVHSQYLEKCDGSPPNFIMRDAIIREIVVMLSCNAWSVPEDFLSFEHFMRELESVDPDSSPGYPYCIKHASNGQMLGYSNGSYSEVRARELYEDMMELVHERSDPHFIRLFIKPEPHSAKKAAEKKWRLISSVSIRDRMLDACLHSSFNSRVVETFPESPIKIGWSPIKGGWKHVGRELYHASDCTAWDWTVAGWIFEIIFEVRKRLCVNPNSEWIRIALKRYADLYQNPWFIASNGVTLKQLVPGIQKSGCYNTLTDNSIGQIVLHVFACLTLGLDFKVLWVIGDDKLQKPMPDEYHAFIGKYCLLKPVENANEFAGFRFLPDAVEPVHTAKHAFNIYHMTPSTAESMAMSYSVIYHRSKSKERIKAYFQVVGFSGLEEDYLDLLWDYWDLWMD